MTSMGLSIQLLSYVEIIIDYIGGGFYMVYAEGEKYRVRGKNRMIFPRDAKWDRDNVNVWYMWTKYPKKGEPVSFNLPLGLWEDWKEKIKMFKVKEK